MESSKSNSSRYYNLILIFIFVLGSLLSSNAQTKVSNNPSYISCEIYPLDAEMITAKIHLPFKLNDKKVKCKINGKKMKLKSIELDYMILKYKDKKIYLKYTKYHKVWNGKLTSYSRWLTVRHSCDKLTTFASFISVDVKKGKFIENFEEGMGDFFVQQPKDKYPHELGKVFLFVPITQKMFDKQRKKALLRYYKDDEEVLKQIESDERITQEEMMTFYRSQCGIEIED